jgi:hypothetical protein
LGLLLPAEGAEVCKNQYCWMWFGRKINSVAGFGGESARLVYITSRYRKPAAPSQRGIPGGCRPQSGSLFRLCVMSANTGLSMISKTTASASPPGPLGLPRHRRLSMIRTSYSPLAGPGLRRAKISIPRCGFGVRSTIR